jgi:hypothetical protein
MTQADRNYRDLPRLSFCRRYRRIENFGGKWEPQKYGALLQQCRVGDDNEFDIFRRTLCDLYAKVGSDAGGLARGDS